MQLDDPVFKGDAKGNVAHGWQQVGFEQALDVQWNTEHLSVLWKSIPDIITFRLSRALNDAGPGNSCWHTDEFVGARARSQ